MDGGLELDDLSAEWRAALADAEDALHDIERMPEMSRLPHDEQRARSRHVTEERVRTAGLLDAVAHEERVSLIHHVAAPRPTHHTLGLPPQVEVCVFDLEALLAGADALQEAAWAEVLDPYVFRLAERVREDVGPWRPFGQGDYRLYLHGRTRIAGLHAFLASRGLRVAPEVAEALARAKSDALERRIGEHGPRALGGSRAFVEAVQEAGLLPVVVSESAHAEELLERTGFEVAVRPDLRGACAKPEAGALYATTAERVAEGRGFGLVVGVDAVDDRETLLQAGAARVVADLGAIY